MKMTQWGSFKTSILVLLTVCAALPPSIRAQSPERQASRILETTGVKGGLIVHIGCGAPDATAITAALRANDSYLVHGLARDRQNLARARSSIRNAGLYGPVSVDLVEINGCLHFYAGAGAAGQPVWRCPARRPGSEAAKTMNDWMIS